ncbi:hypothetical protein [Barnesiella intestinihominis]|jgi:putative lipoprotein|uniref:hypothetical protein n=1 Tax=Barnesiella intestinihominis TaxID=487174 RepID=UPI00266CE723|nr:hypothetical protein [Barnesiella intestinihominis]
MKRTGNILILLLITIIATSCDGGDRDRIPAAAVRVEFANQAMWDQYGVSGSFIHRRFILNQKIPAGFPYTLSSATGYGGLMLITNEHGVPYVYDLCCPVEINSNIRIEFDENNLCLRCPKCGSTYDITTGGPMTGTAKEGRYFLQSYNIAPYGSAGGQLIYR